MNNLTECWFAFSITSVRCKNYLGQDLILYVLYDTGSGSNLSDICGECVHCSGVCSETAKSLLALQICQRFRSTEYCMVSLSLYLQKICPAVILLCSCVEILQPLPCLPEFRRAATSSSLQSEKNKTPNFYM